MAHGASAASINEAVRAIMMAKPPDTLTGHPNTENVDHLEKQMENFCASVRTTAWGVLHGCLALYLSDYDLSTDAKGTVTVSALRKPDKINSAINEDTSNFDQLSLKADQDTLWMEWWTKLSVIDVGVKHIVANVDPQYLE